MKRLTGLDGLRGILALGVALSHAYSHFTGWHTGYDIFHNADYAVDIFFILSGIVLYHSYSNKISTGEINFKEFLFIRAFRLYPLHLIAVLFVPVALHISTGYFFPQWLGEITPWNLIGDFTLTNSIGIGFIPKTNIPSWSISVELFAGTFVLLLSFIHRLLPLATAFLAIILCIYFNIDVKGASQASIPLLSDGVIRCIYSTSLGICALQVVRMNEEFFKKNIVLIGKLIFIVLMVVLIILFGMNITLKYYLLFTPLVALAVAALPLVSCDIKYFLESSKLVFLGKISFSLYLMHTPVIYSMLWLKGGDMDFNILAATLSIIVACFISILTSKYIEIPFYNFAKKIIKRQKPSFVEEKIQ